MKYIDCLENEMHLGSIDPNKFLSSQAAQGLNVTLHSTIELSMYLLE